MGFRNPITTATAVDTGRGLADAGVRLYQDTSTPGVPRGIAEWRTGLMDRNARTTLSGGGSGGSSFLIDGGAADGLNAPTLQLNIESARAGGYRRVARLSGGDVTAVDNLASGPWARGNFLNIDGSTNLPGNNAISALRSVLGTADNAANWTAWNPAGGLTGGLSNPTPGRYLIVGYLADNYAGARYESLSLVLDDGSSREISSGNSNAGYGGLLGSYVYDAPAGPSFGFRFGGSQTSGVPGSIRTAAAYWSIHYLSSLAAL